MCQRLDIFMAAMGKNRGGCLQSGDRPVLIISNDMANRHSPVVTVIPFTGRIKGNGLPTHVLVEDCELSRPSMLLAEQVTSISRSSLGRRMGSIRDTVYEERARHAVMIQLSLLPLQ